jgi:predicted ArsR family transcriptional regulator
MEQVEILALLARSARPRTASGVGTELGLRDSRARHHIEVLVARGLLHVVVGRGAVYSYGPRTRELRRYADELLEYYARDCPTVMRAIAANPRHLN